MTPEQFCYWLQGRIEMQPDNPPSPEEWKMIGEHLGEVFRKVTPPIQIDPLRNIPRDWGVPGDGRPHRIECTTAERAIAIC